MISISNYSHYINTITAGTIRTEVESSAICTPEVKLLSIIIYVMEGERDSK
jgi:hypothetical protein